MGTAAGSGVGTDPLWVPEPAAGWWHGSGCPQAVGGDADGSSPGAAPGPGALPRTLASRAVQMQVGQRWALYEAALQK